MPTILENQPPSFTSDLFFLKPDANVTFPIVDGSTISAQPLDLVAANRSSNGEKFED